MQIVYIDLIPQKEKPIVNLSQYDNDRVVRFMLLENGEEYTLTGTETIDVNIKKPDGNIVVITPTVAANHYVDVLFTEQAAACYGQSVGELSIKENSTIIGTCNFILDVEKSPTCGGIQSATEIENLKTQVDAITMEYLINNTDEIAEVIANKIYPTLEASGDIATFNTILQLPLVSVTANPAATTITRCGLNLYSGTVKNSQCGSTGSINLNAGANYLGVDDKLPVLPNTQYSFACFGYTVGSFNVGAYDQDGTFINRTGFTANVDNVNNAIYGTFTTGENTHSLFIYAYDNAGGYTDLDIAKIMLVKGSYFPNPYEVYNGTTKPIAEATTIKTLTGVNNVFTDNGPVTVKYKYFPDI